MEGKGFPFVQGMLRVFRFPSLGWASESPGARRAGAQELARRHSGLGASAGSRCAPGELIGLWLSKPLWLIPFWGIGPPILEPILVGIGMLTGGKGF